MAAKLFRPLVALCGAVALATIMVGGYVTSSFSGLGCGEHWFVFLCNGDVVPDSAARATTVEWTHRLSAMTLGMTGLVTLYYTARFRREIPDVPRRAVYVAASLFASQAALGALVVFTALEAALVAVHAGVAASILASLAVAFVTGRAAGSSLPVAARAVPVDDVTSRPVSRGVQDRMSPYVELVKPGILVLLLVVGAAAILIAPGEISAFGAAATLVGGGLAAMSAAVMNNIIERDRDAQMARTRQRAIPSGRVTVRAAWTYAGALAAASVLVLATFVNWLSAAFAMSGLLFYVVVYTMWLKPTTPQNVVIGGAAGCMPALVGWAAVTNDVALAPVILGLLVFLWTPPHFWALALVYKDDYAKAAYPMHPNVKGERATRRQVLVYSVLTVAASLTLVWPLGVLGAVYASSALALGGVFLWMAVMVLRSDAPKSAYRLFWYSILYLGLLYGAMVLDRTVVRAMAA